MDVLDRGVAQELLDASEPPCLSLYQPTHRHHPENRQDPIRFRNLVKALEESLLQKYPTREIQRLLDPFLALADDRDFWDHTLDGLAVLAAPGMFRVFKLQRPVSELVVAADSLHTKPLLRVLQSADRYHVLGLSRQEIKLFAGNRDALDEIEPAQGVPRTITEALGEELTDPHQTVASYGGAGGSQTSMHHGHGGKTSDIDIDTERFFRAVDRGILERHSQPSALPLILATLPEHRQLFHQVSHNPFLVDRGIDTHPDALSGDELRARAWQVMEPRYLARLAALAEAFGVATSNDLGDDELAHIATAVVAGRVATLLIDADREVPGRIDAVTGDFEVDDLADPTVDDVLDDLAVLSLRFGAQVVIVPTERMPTETGVAAIYRY
jgi:Bacterial archaeo-eukaryotic release factor family 3